MTIGRCWDKIKCKTKLIDVFGGTKMSEMEKKTILDHEGHQKLQEELEDLKVNKRKEIAQKIKEAREQGDLSENAEYDAAKDEQRDIEARIEELEKILKNVEVVDDTNVNEKVVGLGSTVKIHDNTYNEDLTFKILGSTQANSLKGIISNESPLGKALLGHEAGDEVSVEVNEEVTVYTVVEVSRNK